VTSDSFGLLSVVLPVYKQAPHIADIIRGYMVVLAGIGRPYEIVLAVNGAADDSLAVCELLARERPQLRVIHDPRPGWGRAVRAGLQAARGDLLCYTNCARTTADDLGRLVREAIANPGVVVKADRRLRDSWRRRLGSFLYNCECRALFGVTTRDINATPKLFSRAHAALLTLHADDDLLDAEFVVTCAREGYPIREVPIFATRRQGGSTTTGYKSALRMYAGAFRLWRVLGAGR
jgi:glycosyltransferase involved in cell wall biosynthesis